MSVILNSPTARRHIAIQEPKNRSANYADRDQRKEKKRKRHHGIAEDEQQPSKRSRREPKTQSEQLLPIPDCTTSNSSPFYKQTSSLYLPISPITQLFALEGLCAEHLSPLLLTYHRPFGGVVLSYSHPRLSEHPVSTPSKNSGTTVLAKAVDAYATSFVWLTADFLIFKPKRGQVIEGWINLQNESHLGVVCWNLFNASIERRRLPRDWKWSGVGGRMTGGVREGGGEEGGRMIGGEDTRDERGQGYFVDGRGRKVEGSVRFRVHDAETAYSYGKGFLTIEGTMVEDDGEGEGNDGQR
ncbi:MAG: hypothetical protein M1823_003084 [Watsoniomyces obsoletus]|nr:MAG: hypothetical protein M1823_003084 [Watsoniomyces obsoletus]